jgi:glutamate-1-semialdehyde 2,1-aminomutase
MSRSYAKSEALFEKARALMPGGVSSPVRAFKHVGGSPIFMARGNGVTLTDEDGNTYTDYCLAWGPLILGHAYPSVVEAVQKAAVDGLAFGTVHKHEAALAERVLAAFPYADRVRFVVSGTEAVMTATRLARAHTKRRLLLKFSGCYHGHVDALMVKAGSGVATLGLAESAGVTETTAKDTLVIPLGDDAALDEVFAKYGKEIAGVILEPLPANNGLLIQPLTFLQKLRRVTQDAGAVLIFDEVITGFRFGFHGFAKLAGVEPDLTTLGKIVGGGLPVGAVAGKKEILELLAPLGPAYQAGTMAGNPVALAAGIATLDVLKDASAYNHLEGLGRRLETRVADRRRDGKTSTLLARVGSVFWPYMDAGPVPTTAETITDAAIAAFKAKYQGWLAQGIYLPPSAYEVGFLSVMHKEADIDALADAL